MARPEHALPFEGHAELLAACEAAFHGERRSGEEREGDETMKDCTFDYEVDGEPGPDELEDYCEECGMRDRLDDMGLCRRCAAELEEP